MLTGKPHEIADASIAIEDALKAAGPAFAEIAKTMNYLGAGSLQNPA